MHGSNWKVLRIEAAIARAHRQLTIARDEASLLNELGLHDDLQLYLLGLENLQEDLLRSDNKLRRRTAP